MTWIKEMFGVEKPVIALLHCNPFPGDPRFEDGVDSMEKAVVDARNDLHALQEGGVDGVLFSNEFSFPYQAKADPVQACGMSRIIGELKREIKVPFGIDLEADPMLAMDLAAAVDACFIRGTFTGTYVGVGGVTCPDTGAILRRKKALGLKNVKLFYFLNNESDSYMTPVDYPNLAGEIIFNCEPDALCVTGAHAGVEAGNTMIEKTREKVQHLGVPVFAATGCNVANVREKLAISDGVLVGTCLKKDGKFKNHVDLARVKEFMGRARADA